MSYQDPKDFDKEKRDTMIRDEFYKRRDDGEKTSELKYKLSRKHYLSEHTIDRIIYPRKST